MSSPFTQEFYSLVSGFTRSNSSELGFPRLRSYHSFIVIVRTLRKIGFLSYGHLQKLIRINKQSFSSWCWLCHVPTCLIPSEQTFSQCWVKKQRSERGACGSRTRNPTGLSALCYKSLLIYILSTVPLTEYALLSYSVGAKSMLSALDCLNAKPGSESSQLGHLTTSLHLSGPQFPRL